MRRQEIEQLSFSLEYELLTGRGMTDNFQDEGAMRAAWETHRDRIMGQWIRLYPCTRPFAWWLFEGVPKHGERRTTEAWTAEHEKHRANWQLHGILHLHTVPCTQEPESEHLARHGLLTAKEKQLLAAGELRNLYDYDLGRWLYQ
jgi:hypothetical protein